MPPYSRQETAVAWTCRPSRHRSMIIMPSSPKMLALWYGKDISRLRHATEVLASSLVAGMRLKFECVKSEVVAHIGSPEQRQRHADLHPRRNQLQLLRWTRERRIRRSLTCAMPLPEASTWESITHLSSPNICSIAFVEGYYPCT